MVSWLLPAVLVGAYGALYAYLRTRFPTGTPQRQAVERFLCCWKDLFDGRAFWVFNLIFSPLVLTIHAFRIYVPSCVMIYGTRLFWLLFGSCCSFFTDEDFPPDDTSLGNIGGDSARAEAGRGGASAAWIRAMDFSQNDRYRKKLQHPALRGTDMCLFQDKIEAMDILQGALGDCWLLAAMATLAEHEGAISSLFLTREVDPRGKYSLQLFDPHEKIWKVIVVDDYVPCVEDAHAAPGTALRGLDGMPVAKYARPHGKEIWAMILEKAFAKMYGSYSAIEAGITEWAIVCMTGGSAWRYTLTQKHRWERSDLVAVDDPTNKRACAFRSTEECHEARDFFEVLRRYHRCGAVLCCGGVTDAGQSHGLVQKHAFSLLQVQTVRMHWESDSYFRFVQVRNPWGTGEWTGPWSDSSAEWDEYPHVKKALGFENKDDGTYWMQWEDFCQYWEYVGVVDCTTDIYSLQLPLYPETKPTGPLEAFCSGCSQYWCLCSGLRHLFMSHQASAQELSTAEFHTKCGSDLSGLYCRACEREMVHVKDGKLVTDEHEETFEQQRSSSQRRSLLGGA